jgi:hypothetical protein
MSFVRPIWQDLRAKRLWPVALVLLVAIIAVPVVLSASSGAPPAGPGVPSTSTAPVAGLPAVSERSGAAGGALPGSARDPFTPQGGGGARAAAAGVSATAAGVSATAASSATTSGGSPSGTGSSAHSSAPGSSGATTPSPRTPLPPSIPVGKPKRTTPALSSTQSYDVRLAITNSNGGLNTIDSLERLSLLPSQSLPLLVELGVLQGGSRVLFAVQPGTTLSGPGTCVPGPIDCEILSLAQDQTEKVGVQTVHGSVAEALFAVTGINAVGHGSSSAAMRARRTESSAGRSVLNHSSLNALSLFRYELSVGAVVDLRNLKVGDS